MIVFNTDLDNTMIYSYKQDIGNDKRCVEIYENREISFITNNTFELLKKVKEKVLVVPTTTRTEQQYSRIDFGLGVPEYALVCNGGVLLINGKEDINWYDNSFALVEGCQQELQNAEKLLENDINRSFEVRNIRKLFIFTKSNRPEDTVLMLQQHIDTNKLDVFFNGVKVYAVPKQLSKGNAIERLRKKLNISTVISAGDSEFDVSMLNHSDIAIAPQNLKGFPELKNDIIFMDNGKVFSESILKYILNTLE